MPVNIVSTVIDGIVLFVTSPAFWLGCVGLLLIMLVVVPSSPFRTMKKDTKENE
ncbi:MULTISPECIES: hypothetical protein [Klebsiella]|uniref:hypothetical protein n=1 Tax=Klebsiella TaxID=570 RepID=UPI001650F8C6|nr:MULTISPECIES: hypothetical protein [Klebsiella]QXD01325.1 hypothetical protein MKleb_5824 [Klebsiella sp. PL-2018]QXD01399.1 hypothetical protein MKleb_5898 [Klebsiella sp. PL-2018]